MHRYRQPSAPPRSLTSRRAMAAMGLLLAACVALGFAPIANSQALRAEELAQLESLRTGALSLLAIHDRGRPSPALQIEDGAGRPVDPAQFRDKIVVVNFWATWCPPCRKEMPSLDRLEAALGGKDFAVVAISLDRAGTQKVRRFYRETGIQNLAIYLDPSGAYSRSVNVLGLPTTLVLDRAGNEVARLAGEAEWDAPEAIELFRAMIGSRST